MAKQAPLTGSTNCLRWFLSVMSIFFLIMGLCMIVAGALTMADLTHGSVVDPSVRVGRALVIFGVGIMMLSFLGCFGALRRSTKMLLIYLAFLVFFLFAQVALVVYGNINTTFKHDIWNSFSATTRTTIQEQLDCCQWKKPYHAQGSLCPTKENMPDMCTASAKGDADHGECWDNMVRYVIATNTLTGTETRFNIPESARTGDSNGQGRFMIAWRLFNRLTGKPVGANALGGGDLYLAVTNDAQCHIKLAERAPFWEVGQICYGAPGSEEAKKCDSDDWVSPYPCTSCTPRVPTDLSTQTPIKNFRTHFRLGDEGGQLYGWGLAGPFLTPEVNSIGVLFAGLETAPQKGRILELQASVLWFGTQIPSKIWDGAAEAPTCPPSATDGCEIALGDLLSKYKAILIGVAVTALIVQLVTLMATVVLIRAIRRAVRDGSAHHQYLASHAYDDEARGNELRTMEPKY